MTTPELKKQAEVNSHPAQYCIHLSHSVRRMAGKKPDRRVYKLLFALAKRRGKEKKKEKKKRMANIDIPVPHLFHLGLLHLHFGIATPFPRRRHRVTNAGESG